MIVVHILFFFLFLSLNFDHMLSCDHVQQQDKCDDSDPSQGVITKLVHALHILLLAAVCHD